MKANIDANGTLTIKAEYDLEHYALKKWYKDWQFRKGLLLVEIAHEGDPNAVTYRQVRNDD